MSSKRNVGAGRVREWFGTLSEAERNVTAKDGTVTVLSIGKRGKLSDAVIAAFQKANKREVYSAGHVEARKITGTRENPSNGRKQTVTVTATLGEVRAWAQSEGIKLGDRGRIAESVLSAFAARPVEKAVKATKAVKVTTATAEVAPVAQGGAEAVSTDAVAV